MDSDDARKVLITIGRNIKAERARAGLRQDEVAHRAELGVAQYARLERGETDSGITKYVRVAQALEVELAVLLTGIDLARGH